MRYFMVGRVYKTLGWYSVGRRWIFSEQYRFTSSMMNLSVQNPSSRSFSHLFMQIQYNGHKNYQFKQTKIQSIRFIHFINFALNFHQLFQKLYFRMEYMSAYCQSSLSRTEAQYNEINDQINKLIEDLGDKVQKDLVLIEQKILLNFKNNLIDVQKNYKQLQEHRNEEVIKENILTLKNEQQKIFNQESEKSLEMNRLYDKLKVDLKQNVQYEHELQLQIGFLTKQCMIAKKKAQMLDEQIKEYDEKKHRPASIRTEEKVNLLPSIRKVIPQKQNIFVCKNQAVMQKRIRNKIETMKDYIDYLQTEQSTIQKIFGKYDFDSFESRKHKSNLIDTIFGDQEFKKYIYAILFQKDQESS